MKAFVAVFSTLLAIAAAAPDAEADAAVITPYAGYAGLGYAGYAGAYAGFPAYHGAYAAAPVVHHVVNPYDYAGQIYPAAVPYVHEDVAAEPYVDVQVAAEPYVHTEIAAAPYAAPYVHQVAAPVVH